MKGKHLTFEERKIIVSLITKGKPLKEIALLLDKDPTTISKEAKRNCEITKERFNKSSKTTLKCQTTHFFINTDLTLLQSRF